MKHFAKIFIPLLVIAAVIAGIVSGVQLLTKDKIAANNEAVRKAIEQKKLDIISSVYGDSEFSVLPSHPETVDEIRASKSGEYCVTLTSDGYKSDSVELFVAFDKDLAVLKVVVLSSKETTGIGTKIEDDSFLSQFVGKSDTLTSDNVTLIAGATFSSKAVTKGINTAREAILSLSAK